MTHDDAVELLPSYAIGALEDASELERHLAHCPRCQATLADYLETTFQLGEAIAPLEPPEPLRARVLASADARRADRQTTSSVNLASDSPWPALTQPTEVASSRDRGKPRLPDRPTPIPRTPGRVLAFPRRLAVVASIAAVLLISALGAGVFVQQEQLAQQRQELALDERGLALLTSTETTVVRLNPVAGLPSLAHGHWYHRDGVTAQVVVVEFLPAPPSGTDYVGWLRHADGRWQTVGRFTLDANGYGRVVLLGNDGSDVREVLITRQSGPSPNPTGVRVLDWSGP